MQQGRSSDDMAGKANRPRRYQNMLTGIHGTFTGAMRKMIRRYTAARKYAATKVEGCREGTATTEQTRKQMLEASNRVEERSSCLVTFLGFRRW